MKNAFLNVRIFLKPPKRTRKKMKKEILLGSLLAFSTCAFAIDENNISKEIDALNIANKTEFKKNFTKLLKEFPDNVNLGNFTQLKNAGTILLTVTTADGTNIPAFVAQDGKMINGLGALFVADDETSLEIKDYIVEVTKNNKKVNLEDEAANAKLEKVVGAIPEEYVLEFNHKDSKQYAIVLTDPECPFCRRHLAYELPELVKQMNVKVYFTPVHPDSSFVKSMLILSEGRGKGNDEKLKIMNKYYDESAKVSAEQEKIDISKLKVYRDVILTESGIRGVPHTSVYDKK